ncbi:unnamed protein product [Spodoptera exigua]|nr:unnamed protein product [Spodoptera exigua]
MMYITKNIRTGLNEISKFFNKSSNVNLCHLLLRPATDNPWQLRPTISSLLWFSATCGRQRDGKCSVVNVRSRDLQERSDMDKLSQVMFVLLCHVTCVAKQVAFHVDADRIEQLIARLDEPLLNQSAEPRGALLRGTARRAARLLRVYSGCAVATCVLWIVFPVLYRIRGVAFEFPFWAGIPYNNNVVFSAVLLYSFYTTNLVAIGNTTMDAFMATILDQCKTQLRILRMNFETLPERARALQLAGGAGAVYEASLHRLFVDCLLHYNIITDTCTVLHDVFAIPLLIQFGVGGWILCMAAYKIVSVAANKKPWRYQPEPEFWRDQPRLWFKQLEAIVAPQKQGDDYKYYTVIAKLPKEEIIQVSDLITCPPPIEKYKAIKERLISCYEESDQRQLQKLLSEMDLSDETIKLLWLNVFSIEFASTTLFIICILIELFIFCYYGNEVTVEVGLGADGAVSASRGRFMRRVLQSERVSESLYSMEWGRAGLAFRRSLVLVMERAKRPLRPAAGRVIPLSLDTYVTRSHDCFSAPSSDLLHNFIVTHIGAGRVRRSLSSRSVATHLRILRRCGYCRLAGRAARLGSLPATLHALYRGFTLALTTLYLLQECIYAYQVRLDMDKLARVMFLLLCHITSIAKQLVFHLKADRIDEMLEGLNAIQIKEETNTTRAIGFRFVFVLAYSYYVTTLVGIANTTMDAFMATVLNQCKTQLRILRTAKMLQDIFGTAILIQFGIGGWILCMAAYKLVTLNVLSVEFASMTLFISCILTELFLYCYYGNEVTDESERVSESLYSMEWGRAGLAFRRSLVLVMERAKRPLRPAAGRVIPLSLDTFVKIIKSSYTFYAVLRQTK